MTNWHEVDNNAKTWINEAAERIRASFPKTLDIQTKSNPNDLVTNIDKETEQFFIGKINATYPEHKILGEEGYGDKLNKHAGVVWIIDPIDGTMNFIHQQRNFAISIGIYENGVGVIGLIYDVVHNELYHAVKGKGAYLNDKKIPDLEKVPVSNAIVGISPSWVVENKRFDYKLLSNLVKDIRGTRSYGSAALEMAYVATGRIDAYISLRLAPWDIAGGAVIIKELGGLVTTLTGEELDFLTAGPVFVSKPGLHEQILTNYLQPENL
ncbi:inositol monophosphatase [Bacillus canaveralius]|uniref:inositol-phosphate phosphatase n=1 Tax=Bacillus canaveralius TaxID=1403243 RepID=A0A2N5GNH6_9BACI|nr:MULTISPECIES: inositol monophosphatase family protein [Bacillus]PLR84062.1 inositol monophosphatase [Bacillus canaveralius]PLR87295.1 inositol monophosphatase [Bacillus sp. V33-4]PLR96292.1 inositol monophosphatase [Bacillus canaveralius]RSK53521.1 inositol monophosphatase family protein [Bacillus canaveralius]